jgi:hypothetical protein
MSRSSPLLTEVAVSLAIIDYIVNRGAGRRGEQPPALVGLVAALTERDAPFGDDRTAEPH